jgi:hypothetical protein
VNAPRFVYRYTGRGRAETDGRRLEVGAAISEPLVQWRSATTFRLARNFLRPSLLVARHAFKASARNCCSTCVRPSASRCASSQPAGLPQCCSIWRASLSPMGRDALIRS